MAFATTLAPIETKNEKKIQMAKVASADVAMPLKRIEKSI
ncbi:unnamed protein product, partial [marine sediment metagenome]